MNNHFLKSSLSVLCRLLLLMGILVSCENTFSPQEETSHPRRTGGTNSLTKEDVLAFYEGHAEMKNEQPYTYIMNKYLDLANFFFEELDALVIDTSFTEKQSTLQTEFDMYNSIYEMDDLESTETDKYFNELYEAMYAEIEDLPCIQNYEDIAVGFAEADGGGEMILEEDEPTLTIGGVLYSKVELLQAYEQNIALPYEYEATHVDLDDPDPEMVDPDEGTNNMLTPKKALRYRLLALWPSVIKYRIYASRCPNPTLLQQAMVAWIIADNYHISFTQISDNGWNRFFWGIGLSYHVSISNETDPNCGGSSTVGYRPWASVKVQSVNFIRPYLHELGHVLCLEHEMQRYDRDEKIRINYENIKAGYQSNFWKYPSCIALPICPFDFESIMMYSQTAFSKNNINHTIDRIDGESSTYSEGTTLSYRDGIAIRYLYH